MIKNNTTPHAIAAFTIWHLFILCPNAFLFSLYFFLFFFPIIFSCSHARPFYQNLYHGRAARLAASSNRFVSSARAAAAAACRAFSASRCRSSACFRSYTSTTRFILAASARRAAWHTSNDTIPPSANAPTAQLAALGTPAPRMYRSAPTTAPPPMPVRKPCRAHGTWYTVKKSDALMDLTASDTEARCGEGVCCCCCCCCCCDVDCSDVGGNGDCAAAAAAAEAAAAFSSSVVGARSKCCVPKAAVGAADGCAGAGKGEESPAAIVKGCKRVRKSGRRESESAVGLKLSLANSAPLLLV